MALYQDNYVEQTTNAAFDKLYKPGETPPHSGIYRCQGCGVEVVAEEARSFPPTSACQNHHPNGHVGQVRWKLLVYAQHKGR